MFQRILVPIDLAQRAQPALSIAAKMARESRGTILLLYVIERIEHVPDEELNPIAIWSFACWPKLATRSNQRSEKS